MKIVLSGVETLNKGAELMLYAILQEIERKHPDAIVYIPLNAIPQGLDYIQTSVKFRFRPFDFFKHWCAIHHIEGILKRLHLKVFMIDDARIVRGADYFINANGFAFSDQCNLTGQSVGYWEKTLSGYYKQGTKIVFMPQAFGPIQKPVTKKICQLIDRYSTLVMPREEISERYLKDAGMDTRKMFLYKDFTSLVDGVIPPHLTRLSGACCIIPNQRMIEKGIMSKEAYMELMSKLILYISNQGYKSYILNHEGPADEELARMIARQIFRDYSENVEVISGLNALEVKGLISTAYLCISSRYHGVASALNSCVPCLATSWSHKYAALFNDYGITDGLMNVSNVNECIKSVDGYIKMERNSALRCQLKEHKSSIQEENKKMWKKIWEAEK